jgi:catechol 2,3-dioxygenase-like lactoylglutathione lyase family enzyme
MTELRWDAVTLDCADPEALATFYCALLGVAVRGRWKRYIGLEPSAPGLPRLVLQGTDDPRPSKNTLHLDLHVASADLLDAEVARVVALGARLVEEHSEAGEQWRTMADPEGNLFDLVAD